MNANNLPHISTMPDLSLVELEKQADWLSARIKAGDMITLRGDLGIGKTAFARALIQPLMRERGEVTSPTFNIMQSYPLNLHGKADTLWHIDLYRLDEPSEAEMLGLRDLEQHVLLIEWPEIIEHNLPLSRLDITLEFGNDTQRTINFYGNESWRMRLMDKP